MRLQSDDQSMFIYKALLSTWRKRAVNPGRTEVEGTVIYTSGPKQPYWVLKAAAAPNVVHTHPDAGIVLHNSVLHASASNGLQKHVALPCVLADHSVVDIHIGILTQSAQYVNCCAIPMVLIVTQG